MTELPGIRPSREILERLEREIKLAFKRQVYGPIIKLLGLSLKIDNAAPRDPLLTALASGRITYWRGVFKGKFSAATSKRLKDLGAKFVDGEFRILLKDLPYELKAEIMVSSAQFIDRMGRINAKLARVIPANIAEAIDFTKLFDSLILKFDSDFQKTLRGISVAPKLTVKARERIRDEWRDNLELDIKNFTTQEIARLRREVSKNVFAGNRHEAMVKSIKRSYGVTESKARFLARQETNLLVTKLRDTRYQEAGVMNYRWQCVVGSPAHPVRPAHEAHNGKTFKWDSPPVVSEPGQPVRRANPGQDFNCRCIARPIVKF